MQVDLTAKTLIVTGSTQGVGAAVARLAAESRAEAILVTGRDAGRAAAMAAEIAGLGTRCEHVAADLADPDAPARIVAAALAAFGRVDLLVNCAALTDRAGWTDASLADWDRLFSVNARAPFFLMQAVIADMLSRDATGAIVNILSVNALCGLPELAVYSATKGALATLTRNAANGHLAQGIRVNGINMGWADTPGERVMQAETLGGGPGWLDRVSAAMPLGRLLSVQEVAQLVVYLLSPQAGMLTGAVIDLEQSVVGAPVMRPGL